MYDQPIGKVMEPRKLLVAPPDTSVSQAARMMAKKNVGAILIVKDKRLLGIFTERDAVFRVIAKGRDAASTVLSEVMTADPATLPPQESYGYALLIMQERGFRHIPVLEDGTPIGIVSTRNAMDPDLEEFSAEASRRNHIRSGH